MSVGLVRLAEWLLSVQDAHERDTSSIYEYLWRWHSATQPPHRENEHGVNRYLLIFEREVVRCDCFIHVRVTVALRNHSY
jgi:predicted metal-dependent hydrolase